MWLVFRKTDGTVGALYDQRDDVDKALARQAQPDQWLGVEVTPRLFFALAVGGASVRWKLNNDGIADLEV